MSVFAKLKLIYKNWDRIDKLYLPEIDLDGYEEYKLVSNLQSNIEYNTAVRIPIEIIEKAEVFKDKVLQGKL